MLWGGERGIYNLSSTYSATSFWPPLPRTATRHLSPRQLSILAEFLKVLYYLFQYVFLFCSFPRVDFWRRSQQHMQVCHAEWSAWHLIWSILVCLLSPFLTVQFSSFQSTGIQWSVVLWIVRDAPSGWYI